MTQPAPSPRRRRLCRRFRGRRRLSDPRAGGGRPAEAAGRLAEAAWAFPLVGAGIGAVAAVVFLVAQLLGLGDWPAALLAVLAGLLLTGALHEDGLADTADGLFGGSDRDAPARDHARQPARHLCASWRWC